VVGQFELLMASSFADGVILSVAAFQAERRACPEPDGEGISRYDTVLREIPRPAGKNACSSG
jgi:hypothetical protein